MKISPAQALEKLAHADKPFVEVFTHGSLVTEIYQPLGTDQQTPHDRDEVYVIISGTGEFTSEGNRYTFAPGDFFFVPAGAVHRFENFSADFVTWVMFYGPMGGE